jgi:hypothetical protein
MMDRHMKKLKYCKTIEECKSIFSKFVMEVKVN